MGGTKIPTGASTDPFAGMYSAQPSAGEAAARELSFGAVPLEADVDAAGRAFVPPAPAPRDEWIPGEQAELQANLAAADARLAEEAARRPPGPGEVLAGQMQGSLGAFGDAASLYARNLPKTARRYNAAFPFVQQKAAERRDQDPQRAAAEYEQAFPFQPEPFQPLPRYEGESEEDYQGRMQIFADADMRSQMDAYERKREEYLAGNQDLSTINTRDIGRAPGAIGTEEATLQGQENVDAAREDQDRELALEQAKVADKQADATLAVAEQVDEQRAIEDAAIKARQVYAQTRSQARKALAEMPQRSREQISKGLSKGTKVAAVLGAIAQGWRGDPITAVNDAIDRGVNEQMERYERKRAEYGDTIAELDDEMAFVDFIVNSVGGNRQAAAAMLRGMHIEDAAADFAAAEARTNVPVAKAIYKQGQVALLEQERSETMAAELQAAQTPEYVGVTRDSPLMRFKREIAKAQMDSAMKEQVDIRKDERGVAIKDAERAADAEVAMQLEGVKQEGAVAAKRAEATIMSEKDIKMKTAAFGAVEQQIDDILDVKGNLHGRGMVWTGTSGERITLDSQLTALKQSLTQAFTGATATEEQQEAFARLVEGDWSELSDEALRARLRALKNIVSSQRRYLQNQIGSAQKQAVSPAEFSTFKPR